MVSPFAVLAGAVLLALTLAGACAPNSSNAIKPAMDAPTHFLVRAPDGKATEPVQGESCQNPMIDPRDGAFLILIRSAHGHGDYQVPVARYGVRKGELLRIECGTGLVVGIVKR
jgi:hypothetical protein